MAFLKVLNVGQGDCMAIHPLPSCKYGNELIFVDLGNGISDISREIGGEEKIRLVLTHSHRDHINGITHLFPYIKMNRVEEIILPFCYNEIWLIAKAIMNLKGMKDSVGCNEEENELVDVDNLQSLLKSALNNRHIKVTFAYDGYRLCEHIAFLNPPCPDGSLKLLENTPKHYFEEIFSELFEKDFAEKAGRYVKAVRNSYGVDHPFYKEFIYGYEQNYQEAVRFSRAGCEIFLQFVHQNLKKLCDFNENPHKKNLKKIVDSFHMTAHDACLITSVNGMGQTCLLGGDASIKAFHRLIREGRLPQAMYFKIPHHGSDKNLDEEILQTVNPSVAIISHGNAKFGMARDTHPNNKLLRMLLDSGIQVLVTNDVIKHNKVVFNKKSYSTNYLEIE